MPRPSIVVMCAIVLFNALSLFAADPFPGNPPITPYWALGAWVWEDMTNTQASTTQLVQNYLSRKIPVCCVMVDSPWETFFNTYVPDATRYAGFAQMITTFHSQGVRVICWTTGWINTDSPDYNTVKTNKYVVNPNSGNGTWWKGSGVHMDHTNPTAQAWLDAKMDNVLNMGLDGWKLDMGPDYLGNSTVTLSAGSTKGTTMPLTDFQKYYYQTIYDHAIAKNPENVITARGYAGTPSGTENKASITKNPLCWQGDYTGDFSGIVSQAAMVYQTAINGYGCPGVEVGGYTGAIPTKNSLIRYAQFGAMTPYMENGGANGGLTGHVPWYWDTTTVTIYRYYAMLHTELAPYNFSGIVDCHLSGGSQMKSCDKSNFTHKLGKDIFVGLITSDVTSRNITLPANDQWIDYWNENATTLNNGGATKTGYAVPLNQFPIFIRAGAIIPMNVTTNFTSHGDSSSAEKITVLLYPYGSSSMTFHRPTSTGVTYEDFTIAMNETTGTLTISGPTAQSFRFRVKSFLAPTTVTGATAFSYDATNKVVIIDKSGAANFTIKIGNMEGYSLKPTAITPRLSASSRSSSQAMPKLSSTLSKNAYPASRFNVYDASGRAMRTMSSGSNKNPLKDRGIADMPYIIKSKE